MTRRIDQVTLEERQDRILINMVEIINKWKEIYKIFNERLDKLLEVDTQSYEPYEFEQYEEDCRDYSEIPLLLKEHIQALEAIITKIPPAPITEVQPETHCKDSNGDQVLRRQVTLKDVEDFLTVNHNKQETHSELRQQSGHITSRHLLVEPGTVPPLTEHANQMHGRLYSLKELLIRKRLIPASNDIVRNDNAQIAAAAVGAARASDASGPSRQ